MTFTCPYCGAQTKTMLGNGGFGQAKCSACKRKFLYMPMPIKEEDRQAWEYYKDDEFGNRFLLVILAIAIALAVFGSFFGIACLIS
jgi:DNA-directed RNA polymerase subunit RPC12/RpoP